MCWVRSEDNTERLVKCCVHTGLVVFYPLATIQQLWHESLPPMKITEGIYESYPQFILQMFGLIKYGFPTTELGGLIPASKIPLILGLSLSFMSVLQSVNSQIVKFNIGPTGEVRFRDVFKCTLYTLPDILLRFSFFPVCWLLLSYYATIVHVIISLIFALVIKRVNPHLSWDKIFSRSIQINVAPQSVEFQPNQQLNQLNSPFSPGLLWIRAKIISNSVFMILAIYFFIVLEFPSLDFVPALGGTEGKGQISWSFDKITNKDIQIPDIKAIMKKKEEIKWLSINNWRFIVFPTILSLAVLSSLEILVYHCCQPSWWRWVVGPTEKQQGDAGGVSVRLKVKYLKTKHNFFL